jgi:hypothetical protein
LSLVRVLPWLLICVLMNAALLATSSNPDPATRRTSARQLDRAAAFPIVPQRVRAHGNRYLQNCWALQSGWVTGLDDAPFQRATRDVAARRGEHGARPPVPQARAPPTHCST